MPKKPVHNLDISAVLDGYAANENEKSTKDFFKLLYQEMIPSEVRHALGEYYTPHWLAKDVVDKTIALSKIGSKSWRALDPTSGSGTFLTVLINRVITEGMAQGLEKSKILSEVTSRVVGIDLNPLAVLTARVNYFLNVAELLGDDTEVEIPVYSGDSAYVPEIANIQGVEFLIYSLDTDLQPFDVAFPKSALRNLKKFSRTMIEIETDIQMLNSEAVYQRLLSLVPASDKDIAVIQEKLKKLADTFVMFEEKKWNGIWARIVTNYLTTSSIGKFDVVVGNPPWVDWKNLPSGYREKIKGLEITKSMFSGDGQTGGINLNVAALITNVVASNWLEQDGVLGMLMPDTLLVQQSYEGYRRLLLGDNTKGYFQEIDDWTKAGTPFSPVTQKFYTYFISRKEQNYSQGIPVRKYVKNKGVDTSKEFVDVDNNLVTSTISAIQSNPNKTNFTFIIPSEFSDAFALIGANPTSYVGREGIEFYPPGITDVYS